MGRVKGLARTAAEHELGGCLVPQAHPMLAWMDTRVNAHDSFLRRTDLRGSTRRPRDARAAVARQPGVAVVDAAFELAAAAVLLHEGVEGGE